MGETDVRKVATLTQCHCRQKKIKLGKRKEEDRRVGMKKEALASTDVEMITEAMATTPHSIHTLSQKGERNHGQRMDSSRGYREQEGKRGNIQTHNPEARCPVKSKP